VATRLLLGIGCILWSLCALAGDQEGGLEQIINTMEQNGATHDMQLDHPVDKLMHQDPEPADEADTPDAADTTDAPAAASAPDAGQTSAAPTTSSAKRRAQAAATAQAPAAQPGAHRQPHTRVARAKVREQPNFPSHNPMADQPPASGGLEQIINVQELNASTPMRVGSEPAPPTEGAARDAHLGESFAR